MLKPIRNNLITKSGRVFISSTCLHKAREKYQVEKVKIKLLDAAPQGGRAD